jgi:hypothetical protein
MTRSSRWGWGRSAAVGGITALAVGALASIGAAVSPSRTPAAASQYPKKVTICHHTHSKKNPFVTITVSRNALPAHLGHGDTIGPCPASKGKKAKASHQKGTHAKKGKKHNAPAETSRARGGTAGGRARAPGHSGSAPRHSATPPGHSGTAPSQASRSPSDSGNASGNNSTAPSQNGTASGHAASPPGHSRGAPGQAGSPRGKSGSAPGHSGSAPGHGTSSPGHSGSDPGHGDAPPGQGKK